MLSGKIMKLVMTIGIVKMKFDIVDVNGFLLFVPFIEYITQPKAAINIRINPFIGWDEFRSNGKNKSIIPIIAVIIPIQLNKVGWFLDRIDEVNITTWTPPNKIIEPIPASKKK